MAKVDLSDLIECGICVERYSIRKNVPKCLPCGHTFCNKCLGKLNNNRCITCPVCMKVHRVVSMGTENVVDKLMTNITIIGLLEYACTQCTSVSGTTRCEHCPVQLCTSCTTKHIHTEYMPPLEESLDVTLDTKKQLEKQLPLFVEEVNKLMEDAERFCSGVVERTNGYEDGGLLYKYKVRDICHKYVKAMDNMKEFITRNRPHVDADLSVIMKQHIALSRKKPHKTRQRPVTVEVSVPVIEPMSVTSEDLSVTGASQAQRLTYHYSPSVLFDTKVGILPREWVYPWGAAVDVNTGQIHVTDFHGQRIAVYNEDETIVTSYKVDGKPHDVCRTIDGYIAVTCGDHRVRIYRTDGTLMQAFGRHGHDFGEFDNPDGITTDSAGLLYVCDVNNHRVQVLERSGAVLHVIGMRGRHKLKSPRSVAVHPRTGQIYVVDEHKDIVQVYSCDGQYETSIVVDIDRLPDAEQAMMDINGFIPRYVSCSADGVLCISDHENSCLYLLQDGHVIQRLGIRGNPNAKLQCPHGTTFTPSNRLVVCDEFNHKVKIFDPAPSKVTAV